MNNTIQDKSFHFAVRIVNLCKYLQQETHEYIIYKQLFRCGTSIGANVAEAQQAQSKADFVSKLSISLKETTETKYWIKLLKATDYLSETEYGSIFSDCVEIEKILVTIIKTTKE